MSNLKIKVDINSWENLVTGEVVTSVGSSSTDEQIPSAKAVYSSLPDISTKQNIPATSSQSAPTAITLVDNTEYTLSDVSSLTFTYPSGSYSVWIKLITAASGTINITFPTSKYIPAVPEFGNNETWLIGIDNGIVIAQKAVDAT